jgi:non-ribosomal peptide synthetase component F
MTDDRDRPTASTADADIPHDVAAWIDEHDPDVAPTDPSAGVLDEQRAEHEPDERVANEAVGQLVNNTGDDGGAATG